MDLFKGLLPWNYWLLRLILPVFHWETPKQRFYPIKDIQKAACGHQKNIQKSADKTWKISAASAEILMSILPVIRVPKMRKALTVFQFMSFPARTCKKLSAFGSKIIKEKSRKCRICFSFQRMAVLCRTKIENYGVQCTHRLHRHSYYSTPTFHSLQQRM